MHKHLYLAAVAAAVLAAGCGQATHDGQPSDYGIVTVGAAPQVPTVASSPADVAKLEAKMQRDYVKYKKKLDHAPEPKPHGATGTFPPDSNVPDDFAMFSDSGNAAVRKLVLAAAHALEHGTGREATLKLLRDGFAKLGDDYVDTEVCEDVVEALDPFMAAAGFESPDSCSEVQG